MTRQYFKAKAIAIGTLSKQSKFACNTFLPAPISVYDD